MRISIITINFNNRQGLEKTITSVISQTYRNIQYIIIDGGSIDGSTEVIKEHQEHIDYWISEPDKGIYNAMNKGVLRATGDYVLFLNSGDYLISSDIINSISHELDSYEDIIFGLLKTYPSGIIGYTDIHLPLTLLDFFKSSPIPHPAAFIKRKLFQEMSYDESLKIVSDWSFFLQAVVFMRCSCKKIEKIITIFEDNGISSQNMALCNEERLKVLQALLPNAVFADYFKFTSGMEYTGDNYELFFTQLKPYKYSKFVYLISVLIVRLISVFKTSALFSRKFPLK